MLLFFFFFSFFQKRTLQNSEMQSFTTDLFGYENSNQEHELMHQVAK